jgi:hypothetical protein
METLYVFRFAAVLFSVFVTKVIWYFKLDYCPQAVQMERKIFNVNYDEGISSGYEDPVCINKYAKKVLFYFVFMFQMK